MLTDSLIDDDVWSDLPEDPNEAFVFLAERARANLEAILNGNAERAGRHSPNTWRRQFVHEVYAAGQVFQIDGLLSPATAEQSEGNLDSFNATLARVLTREKLQIREKLRTDTAALSFETKTTIRSSLESLRDQVNRSNLSDEIKQGLHRKIDAVEQELDRKRSSLRPLWLLAGAIAAATPGAIGAAADLPGAYETVQSAISLAHGEKQAEEQAKGRYLPPKLPAPQAQKLIEDRSER